MNLTSRQLKELAAAIGAKGEITVVRQPSRRVTLLELRASGKSPRQLLLLQHSLRDRQQNPQIARDEFNLLCALWGAGMPVPRPLHLDVDGEIPYFVTERVDGETRFTPNDVSSFCDELAQILSTIHSFDVIEHDLIFLPAQQDRIEEQLRSTAADRYGIKDAMKEALPQISMKATALLHGDFWLGNLLWRGDELAAIIDWEDAMLGNPLGDLGKCRLETLWALGEGAMGRLTSAYLERNPTLSACVLPFWDLWGALRLSHFADWSDDRETIARMNSQYEVFVRHAINGLKTIKK